MTLMARVDEINDAIALKITAAVGTMYCAYAFAALAIYGFPWHDPAPGSVVQWTSQEFIQLVLLSIIMVGQRVQAEQITDLHGKHDELHRIVHDR